jgi:hypothetical protein
MVLRHLRAPPSVGRNKVSESVRNFSAAASVRVAIADILIKTAAPLA